MSVVEVLSKIIENRIGKFLKSNSAKVDSYPPQLTFNYKLDFRNDSWPRIIDESILLHKSLLGLNDNLKYKIFESSLNTGKITFWIIGVHVNIPSIPELQSGKYDRDSLSVDVYVVYEYIHISYFDMLPDELNIIMLSKFNTSRDIKSLCRARGECSDSKIWRETFKLRYPLLFQTYIKLGLSQHLNEASYLTYIDIESGRTGVPIVTGLLTEYIFVVNGTVHRRGISLDLTPSDKIAADKVIMSIKYSKISDVINSDPILNESEYLRNFILLNGVVNTNFFIERYPMMKYVYTNDTIDTNTLIKSSDLRVTFAETLKNGDYSLMYLLLLLLDFKSLNFQDVTVFSGVLYIIDGVEHLDEGLSIRIYASDTSSLMLRPEISYPMLRSYMNKIKSENIGLYDRIVNMCKSPSDEYRHLCNVINEFVL